MSLPTTTNGFAFPVFARGAMRPAGSALIALEDQGFQLGLALFETLLVESGHAYFLARHLERLRQAAQQLGIPWQEALDPQRAVEQCIQGIGELPAAPSSYVLRVTLSAGVAGQAPGLWINARSLAPPPGPGLKLWVSGLRVIADELAAMKSTSRLRYALAHKQALAAGCHDALLLNTRGELAECCNANVFLYARGLLRTPPMGSGCLGGIMRQLLLEDLEREPLQLGDGSRMALSLDPVGPEQLEQAEELLLSNSSGRLLAMGQVLGCERPPANLAGSKGEVFTALAGRIRALEEMDRV